MKTWQSKLPKPKPSTPKKPETQGLSCMVPQPIYDWVKAKAALHGCSMAEIMKSIIAFEYDFDTAKDIIKPYEPRQEQV